MKYSHDIYYLSESLINYERKVETLSTALSLTGGLMGIVNAIVGLLIGWLQRHLFLSTLISKIFHQEEGVS
jgi:hypothetical protein